MEKYQEWMGLCLEQAHQAEQKDEVPVGAVVVCDGAVVSVAHNLRESRQSPSAHAELLALEAASLKLGSWRLSDCILLTTLEPCVMCAGALIQARIKTLVFGAKDLKGGAESVFGLLSSQKHNHRVEMVSGVLEEQCSQLLKEFFRKKRQ
ncbi:tRNA adenosine(34) deaminase TadA [bacterium]|nr:tRNA adenosine(34) deaminase TadA [bacterium]